MSETTIPVEGDGSFTAVIEHFGRLELPSSGFNPERVARVTVSKNGGRGKTIYFVVLAEEIGIGLKISGNGKKIRFSLITNKGREISQAFGFGKKRKIPVHYESRRFHSIMW